jgi:hypothetical protein
MTFRMRHLLPVLLLAASAGAQPGTSPADVPPAEAPPVIKGEPAGRVIRAEDVNVAVRSVRHQVIYEVADGVLKPAQQGPIPARLRCEVILPPGTEAMPSFRSEVTAIEDDNAEDLLKPFRTPDGKANVGVTFGAVWNNEQKQGPMWIEAPLPAFPRWPHTVSRVAGLFTLSVPAEAKSFDLPLDKIGATAAVSDNASITLVSCNVENNGVYQVKLRVKGLGAPGVPAVLQRAGGSMIRSAVGVGPDKPDGKKGDTIGAMNVAYGVDGVTVQFAPSTVKFVKTLRLIVTTKTVEVPLRYDIRTRPLM